MPDPRHPKQYPRGPKHPRLQLTGSWKALVRQTLEANLRAGRSPTNPTELARMIGADKAGLFRMLDGEQPSYKYARQICDLLGIEPPMVENPAISRDEWDEAVAIARSLPADKQRRALRVLKAAIDDADD